jgi:hypothetical protein
LRDAARTRELEACGFLVMRVTNLDVYENLEGVLEAIRLQLEPDWADPLTRLPASPQATSPHGRGGRRPSRVRVAPRSGD